MQEENYSFIFIFILRKTTSYSIVRDKYGNYKQAESYINGISCMINSA